MTGLDKSLSVLKEAFKRFKNVGLAWSTGKDSTLCLYLMRRIKMDFPVIFTDTYVHFRETIIMRDAAALDHYLLLNLHIAKAPENRIEELVFDRVKCCHYHKTAPFLKMIETLGLDAVVVGVRWDEHSSRSQETYFHEVQGVWRIHPILHWKWQDVIEYSQLNLIPMNDLYGDGYTSIGCRPCTQPNLNVNVERDGRSQDKEVVLSRLRAMGYF